MDHSPFPPATEGGEYPFRENYGIFEQNEIRDPDSGQADGEDAEGGGRIANNQKP